MKRKEGETEGVDGKVSGAVSNEIKLQDGIKRTQPVMGGKTPMTKKLKVGFIFESKLENRCRL